MKRRTINQISKGLLFFLIIFAGLLFTREINYRSKEYKRNGLDWHFQITAHRGNSVLAPENTLPAVEQAIISGADMVEIDVRQTKDNVLVLLHDNTLARTTGAGGHIWDYTYEELCELDAGQWFDQRFAKTKIPTLEEVLKISKGKIKINVEIKNCKTHQNIAAQVVDLIARYEMEDECAITSTNYNYLKEAEARSENIRTGIILNEIDNPLKYPEVDFYSVKFTGITEEDIRKIHELDKEVHVWTVDDIPAIIDARGMHVDNVITNDPGLAGQILHEQHIAEEP